MDTSLSEEQRLGLRSELLQRVRKHLEADELDAPQYELITKMIKEELSERA